MGPRHRIEVKFVTPSARRYSGGKRIQYICSDRDQSGLASKPEAEATTREVFRITSQIGSQLSSHIRA